MKDIMEVMDPSSLSAFSVYKNLVSLPVFMMAQFWTKSQSSHLFRIYSTFILDKKRLKRVRLSLLQIPGVKSYEETNVTTSASARRKRKKKKKMAAAAAAAAVGAGAGAVGQESSPVSLSPPPVPQTDSQSIKGKKAAASAQQESSPVPQTDSQSMKKRKMKAVPVSESEVPTQPDPVPLKKKKKMKKVDPVQPETAGTVEPGKKKKKKVVAGPSNGVSAFTNGGSILGNGPTVSIKKKKHIEKNLNIEKKKKKSEKSGISSLLSSSRVFDSVSNGKSLFEWLISPIGVGSFFDENWEKRPLLLKRESRSYYSWLLSSGKLDEILRRNDVRFGKNLDVTAFVDGKRETHTPEGRAMPPVVWDYYANGCSLRFLNPQAYVKNLWRLNSSLQVLTVELIFVLYAK